MNPIRRLRADLGITQRELADRANQIDPLLRLSSTSISRYEAGREPGPHIQAVFDRISESNEPGLDRNHRAMIHLAWSVADGIDRYAENAADAERAIGRALDAGHEIDIHFGDEGLGRLTRVQLYRIGDDEAPLFRTMVGYCVSVLRRGVQEPSDLVVLREARARLA